MVAHAGQNALKHSIVLKPCALYKNRDGLQICNITREREELKSKDPAMKPTEASSVCLLFVFGFKYRSLWGLLPSSVARSWARNNLFLAHRLEHAVLHPRQTSLINHMLFPVEPTSQPSHQQSSLCSCHQSIWVDTRA